MTITRTDNTPSTEVHGWYWWRPTIGAEKEPGIRISRGKAFVWIPFSDAFHVASAIADALEEKQRRANERKAGSGNV